MRPKETGLKTCQKFNSCVEFVTVGVKTRSRIARGNRLRLRQQLSLQRIIGMRGARMEFTKKRMARSHTSSRVMGVLLVLSSLYCLCFAEKGKLYHTVNLRVAKSTKCVLSVGHSNRLSSLEI